MNLTPLFRKVILGAGEASLDIAGSTFLPGAWPVLKGALEPVIDRLKERFGGEKVTASPERAQKAVNEFEADQYLQEMLHSRLVDNLDAYVKSLQPINEDIQKLMRVVLGDHEVLQELVGGVKRIEEKLEEGVNLSPKAVDDVVAAISKRAETHRQVRALALREMGPVAQLVSRQAHRLQIRAVELVEDKQLDRARDELREGLLLVAALLNEAPSDLHLLMQMAMIYKTLAQVQQVAGQPKAVEESLAQAEKIFRFVKDGVRGDKKTALDLANAVHGLGNMKQMRGEFRAAIENYEEAVSLDPQHCYAWHDMFLCYVELAKQGEADLGQMRMILKSIKETGAAPSALGSKRIARLEEIFQQLEKGSGERRESFPQTAAHNMSRMVARNFTLVVWEPQPGATLFNLDCEIDNDRPNPVVVPRLDARVVTPSGKELNFGWTVFYKVSASGYNTDATAIMTQTGDAGEIRLQSGESMSLGIQFQGPTLGSEHFWPPGEYRIELEGRIKGEAGQELKILKTSFSVAISKYDKSRIDYWVNASEKQWDALNDPDRAVGISLPIRDQQVG